MYLKTLPRRFRLSVHFRVDHPSDYESHVCIPRTRRILETPRAIMFLSTTSRPLSGWFLVEIYYNTSFFLGRPDVELLESDPARAALLALRATLLSRLRALL